LFDFELRGKSAASAFIDLSSWHYKRVVLLLTRGAIVDLWSTIRMRSAKR
jgi:hypothetical protein